MSYRQRQGDHGRGEFIARDDGARIYAVSEGEGPTVVLAHGYLLEHAVYDEVFARLVAAGYRVIAFDQRGHGRSTVGAAGAKAAVLAADYRALLEHYDVQHGTLVAHSMGAFLTLSLCLREPALTARALDRLVLLGPNAGAVAVGSLQNRLQIPLLKSGAMGPLWRFATTGRLLARTLFGDHPAPAAVEQARLLVSRQHVQATLPMLEAMLHEDLYPRLPEIPIETVVLAGERDATCPRWHAARIGAELPNARNVWLPGLGHMLMYEAPEAIVEAVRAPAV